MQKISKDRRRELVRLVFPRKPIYIYVALLPVFVFVCLAFNLPEWILFSIGGAYILYGYAVTKAPFFRSRTIIEDALKSDGLENSKDLNDDN